MTTLFSVGLTENISEIFGLYVIFWTSVGYDKLTWM